MTDSLLPVLYHRGDLEDVMPDERAEWGKRRYAEALRMRARGHSYEEIAEHLGIAIATAKKYVDTAIKKVVREDSQDIRVIELRRLDELLQVYLTKALEGHGPSCDRVLMIMERRSRLQGLDAPIEIDYASVRDQFFKALRNKLPHEDYVRVLQGFVDER